MKPRYGILVQTAQLAAQLFIDWRGSCDPEPFAFIVPGESIELKGDYSGVLVTISPIPRKSGKDMPVVRAIRDTLKANKRK